MIDCLKNIKTDFNAFFNLRPIVEGLNSDWRQQCPQSYIITVSLVFDCQYLDSQLHLGDRARKSLGFLSWLQVKMIIMWTFD